MGRSHRQLLSLVLPLILAPMFSTIGLADDDVLVNTTICISNLNFGGRLGFATDDLEDSDGKAIKSALEASSVPAPGPVPTPGPTPPLVCEEIEAYRPYWDQCVADLGPTASRATLDLCTAQGYLADHPQTEVPTEEP